MDSKFPIYTDFDKKIWVRELDSFVPEKIFDFHTHIWDEKDAADNQEPDTPLRLNNSLKDMHSWSRTIFPGRKIGYVALPTPLCDIDYASHNSWVASEVQEMRSGETSDFLFAESGMLVHPDFSDSYLRQHIQENHVKVLKPYRTFAHDPAEARIIDFFPENQMAAANEFGLGIVLHLSKRAGPADKDNINDLQIFAKKYPNIKWVLAHCARAFNSVHLEEAVHQYAKIPTVWVDTSAVNDTYTHALLLRYFDRERILFGTDNVAAGSWRGKYITFGNGWKAFTEESELEHCDNRCTFVVYEQLRCQKQAAGMLKIGSLDIENIFYHNAVKFFQSFS
ncbi:MAG: amidohydrolase family protein [Bacteroidetes bacterium]|nr:amidohydrolase family protein [Bacteroidota bacterium]